MPQLQSLVTGARLEASLFDALQDGVCRDAIRRALVAHYFAPDVHPLLLETGQIVRETYEYSLQLYAQVRRSFRVSEADAEGPPIHQESRSAGFRRVIVSAYDHTCAFCELRLVTPEGRTAVEAAHIIPWSESRNDDPRNGLALCGLHHWSFDNGLASVDSQYRITLSPLVHQQSATSMQELEGKAIVLPHSEELLPHPDAFRWHRRNRLRTDLP